jgi:hypothetical protein
MLLEILLIAGALGWLASEAMALINQVIGVLDGTIGTIALFVLAAGVFALRNETGMARAGRVGIVLVSFAALSFAMVLIITLTAGVLGALANGEITYGEIVWTPFYLLALVFMVGGLVGFGLHYRAQGQTILAVVFGLVALAHLARIFAYDSFWLHTGAGMVTALIFAFLGMRRIAGRK